MSDTVRRPSIVLDALKHACAAYPDQRVTQVIVNALGADPFYTEDTEAAARLMSYAAKKFQPVPAPSEDRG